MIQPSERSLLEGKLQLVPDTSVKNRYYVCGIHISPVYQVRIDKHQDSLDNSGNTLVSMFFEMLSPYLQKKISQPMPCVTI